MDEVFKKVSAGEELRIPAKLQNYVIDAVRAYLESRAGGGGGSFDQSYKSTIVAVENDTGDDLPEFSVVGIEGPAVSPDDDEDEFLRVVRLVGRTPDGEDDLGKFGVMIAPVASGDVGRAVISGVVAVQVDDGDGTTDFADVADGQTDSLEFNANGSARVLWRADGSGKQWAVVRIGAGGAGGVDILQGGTNVVTSTPFLNMATNRGTTDILEFVPTSLPGTPPVPGSNGADLQFKSGGSTSYVGIYWSVSAGKWIIDRLRYI